MSTFETKRVARTYTQKILAAPERVFPLLCPVREKEWLDGWDLEMVYSLSGVAEYGCIFKTRCHDDAEDIWVITRHEPASFCVEFAIVTSGYVVCLLRIRLEANGEGATAAHISYTFTALSEKGNQFIDAYTESEFFRRMKWWEEAMNHFLQTGAMLKSH
jgi:hypothetical protein